MSKVLNFYRDAAIALGLKVERTEEKNHYKLYLRAKDGRAMVFVVAKTASDHRAAKNNLARLRRFAAGQ